MVTFSEVKAGPEPAEMSSAVVPKEAMTSSR
jgi:hypothetical protein